MHTRRQRWITHLGRAVPVRWREAVLRDVREDAAHRGHGAFWTAAHVLAIAWTLRVRAFAEGLPTMHGLLTGFHRDLAAGWRRLRRSTASTAISVGTLAVGVAAVVMVATLTYQSVWRPLPFRDADRLVAVWRTDPATPQNWLYTTAGDFVDWRRDQRAFDAFVGARNISMAYTSGDGGGAPLMRRVTHGWFETLGVVPILGRTFSRDEDRPNGPPVAVVSYATWQRRFAARQDVIGQTVELDHTTYAIIGVLPQAYYNPAFVLVDQPEVFLPMGLADAGEPRTGNTILAVGRLADGVTMDEARRELSAIADSLAVAHPDTNRQFRASVQFLSEHLVRPLRTPLLLLLVAVGGLFAAACGNVGNLQLVQALGRHQERAVQQALGAPRLRLFLQQVAESAMLAIAAGIVALGIVSVAGPLTAHLVPPGVFMPSLTFSLGSSALVLTAGVLAFTTFAAAIPSLWASTRRMEGTDLGAGAMRSLGTRDKRRWAAVLIGIEMAIAVILLTGAGLAKAGLIMLRQAPVGFNANDAFTFRVSTRGPNYAASDARHLFFARLADEFRRMPGVESVGGMSALPIFDQFNELPAYRADVADRPPSGREPRVSVIPITEGFLPAMGMTLRDGRDLTARDDSATPPVALLSRQAAIRVFGHEQVVGLPMVLIEGRQSRTVTVIGVVNDVRSPTDPTAYTAIAYVPLSQSAAPTALGFVVRSPNTPANAQQFAEQAIARIDASMPLYVPRSLAGIAAALEATPRFTSVLLSIFAAIGVLLVASGLYGTIAHLVNDRRREMGVRLALGATRASVLRLVLLDGLRPAVIGMAVGWIGAIGCGQAMARAVAGVPAFDAGLFVGIPLVLLAVGALASLSPAMRATRVNPTAALRQ